MAGEVRGIDPIRAACAEAAQVADSLCIALTSLGESPEPTPYAVALTGSCGRALRLVVGLRELAELRERGPGWARPVPGGLLP